MNSKRVYILGAGSSISHSNGQFPKINEFFSVANEKGLFDIYDFSQIIEYVKTAIGKNIKIRKSNIDIEDLLTHIEIEIERSALPKLLSIRQEILTFIRKLFIQLTDEISGKKNDYNSFVNSIIKSDTIITFNWDILLDNCFGREKKLSQYEENGIVIGSSDHYNEFIFTLTALAEGTRGYPLPKLPYSQWNVDRGYYIKLHGSVDWFYCANEACRSFRKVYPELDLKNELFCSYCHEELNCMIIPPILNKGYKKYPLIRTLWNLASKEISIADEIVIWGYSLPTTDFYSKWLLRQARRAPIKKLTIINPSLLSKDPSKSTLRIGFVRKYYDIFREQLPKKDLMNSLFLYKNYNDYNFGKDIFEAYGIPEKEEKYSRI